ncbi:hypothetical protein BBJK_00043 [Bifidobacterium bifidum LMG 13195]|uniref:Uncharacterized protein n=1 Tax=Bifidobacterium bifidum LMG 13195 TaxID=1207542 RepID=A0A286T9J5_BIFBI|nr:hypothetical protein BBJK_00043 [Bifidobacterium bifidum LMG 13195]
MDGKAGDGTGTAVRPRTLLLSTPPRTPKANPDDTPQVRRQTPLPTIRKTGRAKADGQAARPAAPIVSGRRFQRPAHSRDETIVKPFSDVELLSYVHALESGGPRRDHAHPRRPHARHAQRSLRIRHAKQRCAVWAPKYTTTGT